MSSLLNLRDVSIGYGRLRILENLEFAVERGDYLALVGSNGTGKTTLLRTLLGLLPPLAGDIEFPDGPVHFGYVPQLGTLDDIFPISALDAVLMGFYGKLGALKWPGQAEKQRAQSALEECGIGQLGGRLLRELSGGQRQRVLIARAIVSEPDILVLDEHTNNLDITGERAIMELVDELHARHNLAVVMVTHSLPTVANHARHLGILREGKFSFAPVDVVLQSDYLSEFYGIPMQVLDVEGRKVIA